MDKIKIEIVFFKPQTIYGESIRLVKKQTYTHVGINFYNIFLHEYQYSDSVFPFGVSVRSKREDCDLIFEYEINLNQYSLLLSFISANLKKGYDLKDVLHFLIPSIKGSKDRYICTEYVVNILNILGIKNINNPIVLPDDLVKLM